MYSTYFGDTISTIERRGDRTLKSKGLRMKAIILSGIILITGFIVSMEYNTMGLLYTKKPEVKHAVSQYHYQIEIKRY